MYPIHPDTIFEVTLLGELARAECLREAARDAVERMAADAAEECRLDAEAQRINCCHVRGGVIDPDTKIPF